MKKINLSTSTIVHCSFNNSNFFWYEKAYLGVKWFMNRVLSTKARLANKSLMKTSISKQKALCSFAKQYFFYSKPEHFRAHVEGQIRLCVNEHFIIIHTRLRKIDPEIGYLIFSASHWWRKCKQQINRHKLSL